MTERDLSHKKQIEVLYEDDAYVVFNKPAGFLVVPSPKQEKYTLEYVVNEQYGRVKGCTLFPCHRLDRDTSGVIIFAKGRHHQEAMMDLFRQKKIKKLYIAFVHGRLKHRSGTIKLPIENQYKENPRQRSKSAVSAITHYKVLYVKKDFSVVEVEPVTGRTNQIRIHFKQIGHPLVGERKFAFGRDYELKFKRTALHAQSIQWPKPQSHQQIKVSVNLPKDMEVFLARHRN